MDNREYTITIKDKTSKASHSPIAGEESEKGQDTSANINKEQLDTAKGFVAYKMVQPYVDNFIQYQIGLVSLKTGNSERQARIQSIYSIGSKMIGLAESVAVGFAVGNIGGAVLGATASVLNSTISFIKSAQTMSIQQELESSSIAIMDVRAGNMASAINGRRTK